MYAQLLMQGFIPDTLLVHPLTWLQFVKDPVMREFAILFSLLSGRGGAGAPAV